MEFYTDLANTKKEEHRNWHESKVIQPACGKEKESIKSTKGETISNVQKLNQEYSNKRRGREKGREFMR